MAKVDPSLVVQGLVARGYKPHEAAGIAGNLAQESGFDTSIQEINPKTESARAQGGGFGLAQWTSKDRKQGLFNMAAMRGVPVDDLDLQLDYLDHELKTTHKKALNALKHTKDPRHAAFVVSRHYEMPSPRYANNAKRMGFAEQFLQMVNPIGTAEASDIPSELNVDPNELKAFAAEYEANDTSAIDIDPNELKAFAAEYDKGPIQKTAETIGQGAINLGGGLAKGVSDVGNTIISAGDAYNDFVGNKNSLTNVLAGEDDSELAALVSGKKPRTAREKREEFVDAKMRNAGVDTESGVYTGGRLIGNIATGVGGVNALASGMKALPVISKLAPSVASFGMKGGNIIQKAAGGAVAGATSAALVDPETALAGGVLGGALPPAIQVAGKVGQAVGNAVRSMARPQVEKLAEKMAAMTGKTADEVADILTNQSRVAEIDGLIKTAPQILQDPNISQVARAVKTNSSMALSNAEQAQQQAYRNTLEGIAPSNITAQDAADKAGKAIGSAVKEDYSAATKAIGGKFKELRNNPEKLVDLPIDKLRATVDQYLGKGTVGKGSGAQRALSVAEDLAEVKPAKLGIKGDETVINAARTPWHKQPIDTDKDNMLQAITKMGGINKEMAQSTYGNKMWEDVPTGLNTFRNEGGHSLDDMATMLAEKGYLPEGSGVYELTEKLYGNAKDTYSMAKSGYGHLDQPTSAQDQLHQQLGDLITELQKKNAPKTAKESVLATQKDLSGKVNFKELQNLRSSIGDLSREAKLSGKDTEAAALKQMVSDIDGHLDDLANNWDGVTPVWLDKYKEARGLHRAKIERFKTGAQSGLFKPKSNGEMAIEGGQIPGKFYSSAASQSRDVQSFKRLVNNRDDLVKELKEFALTKAGQTATATGNLANGYVKWAKTHSGANKELFTTAEKAKIDAVAKHIGDAAKADALGMVKGSDTAQKAKSVLDLGFIDNKALNVLAQKIPMGNAALSALREASGRERSNMLAELLADPGRFAAALRKAKTPKAPGKALVKQRNILSRTVPAATQVYSAD